jgi:hypothetical protein
VGSGEVSVVAVGDGVAMGDVCVVGVTVGAGAGLAVAVGSSEGAAVGEATVSVGSGLDRPQPVPQRLKVSARATRTESLYLLIISYTLLSCS